MWRLYRNLTYEYLLEDKKGSIQLNQQQVMTNQKERKDDYK